MVISAILFEIMLPIQDRFSVLSLPKIGPVQIVICDLYLVLKNGLSFVSDVFYKTKA